MVKRERTYAETIRLAINDIAAHGYDSAERVKFWSEQIRQAAKRSMKSDAEVDRMVREALAAIYKRQVDEGAALRLNPGVQAYTIERIKPELRAELDRRIAASADLIRLNREQSVAKTIQRFQGWATSIPVGGSETVERAAEKQNLRKALSTLPYTERRCIIDQSNKLVAAINDTVATNGGAIGAFWQSHKYTPESRARPDHAARDGVFFLLKDSWAHRAGYVKLGGHQWTDEVVQPKAEIFCSCSWVWRFSLRSIPEECLTKKGKEALAEARRKVAAMSRN